MREVRARAGGEPAAPLEQLGPSVSVDLPLPRRLPDEWVPDLAIRLDFYQRLAAAQAAGEVEEIAAELQDRFGEPPEAARNLLDSVRVRVRAARIGAVEIRHDEERIILWLAAGLSFSELQRRLIRIEGVDIGSRAMRYAPPRRAGQPLREALSSAPWCSALCEAIEQVEETM